jgi:hypothetical protein
VIGWNHEAMPKATPAYTRFRSRYRSASGVKVGIFGLVNVLGRHGMLTPDEERARRESNNWYDAAYPDPARAEAWFKTSAQELLGRVGVYLAILGAHAVAWEQVWTDDPGKVVYEDAYQVVAVPPVDEEALVTQPD